MAATSENKPKQYISVGDPGACGCRKDDAWKESFILPVRSESLEELTMEMRFWTCIRWREAGDYHFFQAGEFCAWRQAGDSS